MVINHISIGTSNITQAIKFYDDVLSTISIKRTHYIENIAAAYGERFEFWVNTPYEGKVSSGNGSHIAFNAPSIEAVKNFHQVALKLGGTCAGEPNYRKEYGNNYYAAFVYDLDAHKIEAVYLDD
ncbi:VOC family protein (plasmid) [Vibrio sp. SS-MA-C1-2]|uniref:VOC family protein n=1 Tax=Vibrio sp. SS-MA-C1-2 TaxID=2908646 RepID=UPI001F2105A9|nr:VOC family protein [Vibrio sp. SS-MA-C1-2]UJF20248.1 VOC family protein [Vibrio sp. SS-MA-C1-2]